MKKGYYERAEYAWNDPCPKQDKTARYYHAGASWFLRFEARAGQIVVKALVVWVNLVNLIHKKNWVFTMGSRSPSHVPAGL